MQTIRSFVALCRSERVDDLNLVLAGPRGWGFEPLLREPLYGGAMMFAYPSL